MSKLSSRVTGFSLVEMAIVIVIITLLLGAVLVPLSAQIEQKNITETQQTLNQINEALIGFALQKQYLPCPDINGDGIADPDSPGTCTNYRGFLPWVTLNTPKTDAWDDLFGYQVSPNFTNTPTNPCVLGNGHLGLCQSGNITIKGRDNTKAEQPLATNVAAVVISYGKNGYGATSGSGDLRASIPSLDTDEITNAKATGGTIFFSRPMSSAQATCSDSPPSGIPFCEFDDMLTWVSPYTLFNRMVAAEELP
jgi:type II secretory pathway pseudopilin PulG